ncbi:MAG TPA: hypothetical protein VF215_02065 [Thermoanaerobaculia bacterium]|jgi:hypothetical protein
MLKKFYVLLALLIIGGYAYAGFTGGELGTTEKGYVPAGSRGARGGSRAFWFGGYRGGK